MLRTSTMGRGIFIVIEGANRVHKNQLKQFLQRSIHEHTGRKVLVKGKPFSYTEDPSPLLGLFLAGWEDLPDKIAHHLFSAHRWDCSKSIMYDLCKGKTIILQRYVATGQVCSMARGNLSAEWCEQFNEGLLKPDVTIYVEKNALPDPESDWPNPDIYETPDMQRKIITQFEQMRAQNPDWLTVNVSTMSPRQAVDHVLPTILNKMKLCLDQDQDFEFY